MYALASPRWALAILLRVSPDCTVYLTEGGATTSICACRSFCQLGTDFKAFQIWFLASSDVTLPWKTSLPSFSSADPCIPTDLAAWMAAAYVSRKLIATTPLQRIRRGNSTWSACQARPGEAAVEDGEAYDAPPTCLDAIPEDRSASI